MGRLARRTGHEGEKKRGLGQRTSWGEEQKTTRSPGGGQRQEASRGEGGASEQEAVSLEESPNTEGTQLDWKKAM